MNQNIHKTRYSMQLFKNIIIALCLAFTLSGCAKMTTIRSAPDYASALTKSNHMLILPPMAEVNSIDAGGKATRQHDYEDHIEHIITEVVVEKLHEKGYHIKPLNRRSIHELKLSRKILAFQEDYIHSINKLYAPLNWKEEQAFVIDVSLKTDTKEIKDSTNGDIIIFAEYFAKHKTSGAMTAEFAKNFALALLGGSSGSQNIEDADEFVSLRVAMIDITNNKILWSNIARDGYSALASAMSNKSKLDRQRVNQLCNTLFASLPAKSK